MIKGSPQLKNGYTRIANELLEALFKVYISNYEWRVIGCIIRYTYGFHRKTSKLSLSFIAKATGISLPNLSRTKKKLLKKNIVVQTDNHELGLQKEYKKWKVVQIDKLSKQTPKVVQMDKKRLSKQRGNKDNIKKTLKENMSKALKIKKPEREKSDFTQISEVIPDVKIPRRGGATYEWQDRAARIARKLGFTPSASWFKFFKRVYAQGRRNLLNTVYSGIADMELKDPEKYFYKVFHNKLREIVEKAKTRA